MDLATIKAQAADILKPSRMRLEHIEAEREDHRKFRDAIRAMQGEVKVLDLGIPVDGTNDTARKANKETAILNHPQIQAYLQDIRSAEAKSAEITDRIERLGKDHALDLKELDVTAALIRANGTQAIASHELAETITTPEPAATPDLI